MLTALRLLRYVGLGLVLVPPALNLIGVRTFDRRRDGVLVMLWLTIGIAAELMSGETFDSPPP